MRLDAAAPARSAPRAREQFAELKFSGRKIT
jgi:hypothetical protein